MIRKKGKNHDLYPVVNRTSWYDLFGVNRSAMTDKHRRTRWEKWKRIARVEGNEDVVDRWSDHGECGDCIHKDGDWCVLSGLPVTINPILTMDHGMIGMACMGAGYTPKGQQEMEFQEEGEELPF